METPTPIDALELNVRKMLNLHVGLKARCESLQSDNQQLKQQIHGLKEEIRRLGEENQLLRLARSVNAESGEQTGDKSEMKAKLNEMIRDIDKCLALLNR